MKTLKLKLYWNNEVIVAQETSASLGIRDPVVKCKKDVRSEFLKLVCLGNYPPATTKFSVPFKLIDVTPVRTKPYIMSLEKKLWLKKCDPKYVRCWHNTAIGVHVRLTNYAGSKRRLKDFCRYHLKRNIRCTLPLSLPLTYMSIIAYLSCGRTVLPGSKI